MSKPRNPVKWVIVAICGVLLSLALACIVLGYFKLYPPVLWSSPSFEISDDQTHTFVVDQTIPGNIGIAIQDPKLGYYDANESFKAGDFLLKLEFEDRVTTAHLAGWGSLNTVGSFFSLKHDESARHGWRIANEAGHLTTLSITANTTSSYGHRVAEIYKAR